MGSRHRLAHTTNACSFVAKGLLVVFNPLDEPIRQTLRVNLYYTGLTETARVRHAAGQEETLQLLRDYSIDLPVEVPAQGMTWYVIR